MSAAEGQFPLTEYAAGWDDAVWNAATIAGLSITQLSNVLAGRAETFERLAEADELHHPESAAYKAGAAYAYRTAAELVAEFADTSVGNGRR
ncbi:helix-turn-helix DNA binding protein [Gordonia phage SallySpecial]|uniref:Helix-turn-helix DNA binding protein n=1 Tax=Gordonia phage SallySpecial TaxID=2079570 RepID=A0A2P1CBZ7_9CAUD|nr:helix-turn-helix DNA binding protein [Gordonia phage SallySpecial]AVJ48768.1 helix-turn-helix DNA binding protein [Gordonia phage SallySpecial]